MIDSQSLLKKLKQLECPDSTPHMDNPLVYHKALGSRVFSVENHSFIDLCSGFGTLPLGHNHEVYKSELRKIIEDNHVTQALGDVYASSSKIEFLETLLEFVPKKFNRAALSVSGGQAVEFAMKTAMLFTSKKDFVVFESGYHGLDLGALALTRGEYFRKPFENWLNASRVHVCSYNGNCEQLENILRSGQIAGIVCEPIQGRGGVRAADTKWLAEVYSLSQKYHSLLIFDEVFSGVARTGLNVLAEESSCDILCMGKAIGGGMPLSACLASESIMNAWPESPGEAIHTGTFFGHALSCAVGNATLKKVIELNLKDRAERLGTEARAYLSDSFASKSEIKDVRGRGLMIAVEGKADFFGVKLMDELRAKGVIAIPSGKMGRSLSITPALNIPESELFSALEIIVSLVK